MAKQKAKKKVLGSKKVKGNNYEQKSERKEEMRKFKEGRSSVNTPGMEALLKKAEMQEKYNPSLPKVKKSVKGKGFVK